jgi:hypothetical protein
MHEVVLANVIFLKSSTFLKSGGFIYFIKEIPLFYPKKCFFLSEVFADEKNCIFIAYQYKKRSSILSRTFTKYSVLKNIVCGKIYT